MAETKTTTETKTVKSSEKKAGTTAAKKTTTAKTASAKAPAKKATTAKAVEVKEPVAEVKAPASKVEKKASTDMLKVTLVKSGSGRLVKQIRTLEALGLRKTNSSNIVPDNAATRGMIFVVKHLVSVEKVK